MMLTGCATNRVKVIFRPPDPDLCSAGSQSQQDMCPYKGGDVDVSLDTALSGTTAAGAVNFNEFSLSLDGTTVIFPQSGSFTLSLKTNSGQTVAASSFTWTKQGNSLIAASPTAIQNWIASTQGTFQEISMTLAPTTIGVQQGVNAIMVTAKMGETILGAGGSVWTTSNCPSGPLPNAQLCF